MDFSALIMQIDNILWATPLIILTFGLALIYCIAIKFGNVTNIKLQWKLLTKGESSEEGLSAFETFCSVAAYRVAVGNIGGVMVAIMYGGPGSVIWMIITALVTSAIAFAENSLGQLYKVIKSAWTVSTAAAHTSTWSMAFRSNRLGKFLQSCLLCVHRSAFRSL